MATVRALSNAVEARDAYTGKHAERVAAYGLEIARAMSMQLTEVPEMEFGFLLHDIGKVAIPDAILYKPSTLTDEERALMTRHPVIGAEIVDGIEFLGEAALVVRYHHERWDGLGYPGRPGGPGHPAQCPGVRGRRRARRPHHRPAVPAPRRAAHSAHGDLAETGKQFDPRVIEAFESIPNETFERIAAEIQ